MDFTNYIFVILLVGVLMTGAGIFYTGMYSHYSATLPAGADLELANFTEATNELNQTVGAATLNSQDFSTDDNPLTQALGYLAGAFNAVVSLMLLPGIFLSMIASLGESMGIFYPSFLTPFITVAVGAVVLIGVLFYWLKVR